MLDKDTCVRSRLAATGALFHGYHPEMQAVHDANASELDALLRGVWPSIADVGAKGQEAAWTILQHAIGRPEVQRRYLAVLRAAAAAGQAAGWQVAMLEDRVRIFEGRLQIYGTQFDWDADGAMSPCPIDDPAGVDARRAVLGLEPLAEAVNRHRAIAASEGHCPPADAEARNAEFAVWARKVGWRA